MSYYRSPLTDPSDVFSEDGANAFAEQVSENYRQQADFANQAIGRYQDAQSTKYSNEMRREAAEKYPFSSPTGGGSSGFPSGAASLAKTLATMFQQGQGGSSAGSGTGLMNKFGAGSGMDWGAGSVVNEWGDLGFGEFL